MLFKMIVCSHVQLDREEEVLKWKINKIYGHQSSDLCLASAGSAIGLGAIWKFPYVAGTSGGGAFLLMFILFTLLIGLPLLMAEFIIGRKTQKDAVESYKELAPGSLWHWVGRLGIITCFICCLSIVLSAAGSSFILSKG